MTAPRTARRAMTGLVAVAVAAVSIHGARAGLAATGTPGAAAVTVTVSASSKGTIGTGFAGFSYEKDRVGAGMFDANDTDLVNLFKLLGPSVLRLGGNLVDIVSWKSTGAGGSAKEIAPADVTRLAGFLRATGWKAIYGINLKTNTAANAAAEAQFASKALGSSLVAFEIGNEPNVYKTESTYETSFQAYAKAIRAKVPGAVFAGPGTYGSNAWMDPFAKNEKNNGLAILSQHTYVGDKTAASVAGMLGSTSSGKFPGQWTTMQNAAKSNGIPSWRMTEANSYFHGGADGVSNVQAAALWSLEYMYGVAAHGGAGVNFHGGTSTQFPLAYSPIVFAGLRPTGVQAVFYGELLWSLAGAGAVHAATVSGGTGVTAWGVGNNVFVTNKDKVAVTATVTLSRSASHADRYLLSAPSLTSKAITVAGSTVDGSGAFHPQPQALTVAGTKVTVTVPANSAALVVTG
jgi:hypothetical protein